MQYIVRPMRNNEKTQQWRATEPETQTGGATRHPLK